jgi:hypothetical protein
VHYPSRTHDCAVEARHTPAAAVIRPAFTAFRNTMFDIGHGVLFSLCQILRPSYAVTTSMRRSMSRWELNR